MTTHKDVQDFVQDWWRTNEQEFAEQVKQREEVGRRAAKNGLPPLPPAVEEMCAKHDLDIHHRDQIPVGVFLESVDPQKMGRAITTNQLGVVAEVGHDLLYAAVCTADEQDDAEFFETAFGQWGPLITAAMEECDLPDRCTLCGVRLPHTEQCPHRRHPTGP